MDDDLQQLSYQCELELQERELIELEEIYKPYLLMELCNGT